MCYRLIAEANEQNKHSFAGREEPSIRIWIYDYTIELQTSISIRHHHHSDVCGLITSAFNLHNPLISSDPSPQL
jgi:hypothetical protein